MILKLLPQNYECNDVVIECPYVYGASCNIKWSSQNYSSRTTYSSHFLRIVVPEEYEYGYLNMMGNGLGGNGGGIVECSPDHKNTQNAILEYNDSASVYQCQNNTASYCCPFGVRHEYHSDDHDVNESDFDYDLVNLTRYFPDSINQIHRIIADDGTDHMFASLSCDDDNCIIECNDTLSCALSTIYFNGTDQSTILVSCSHSFSCLSTTILLEGPSPDADITVICSGEDSCNEVVANLSDFKSFHLYCVGTGSCQEVTVNLDVNDYDDGNPYEHGVIHCVQPDVCNDLTLNTNSEHSQLVMYEFSRGIVLNNGIGYLSAIENIECNTNRWIEFDGLLETDSTVIQSVHNEYEDDSFPCEGVEVQCDNDTVSKSCVMTYNYIGSDIVDNLNNASDMAFAVNIDDLYRITCNGECEESPTQSPTAAPTRAPSVAPSTSPSLAPSTAPTFSPSQAPTRSPSVSPSLAPSLSPSVSPTSAPTGAPTGSPTQFPTKSDAYDTYIEWQYMISGMSENEWQFMVDDINSFSINLTSLITDGFDDDKNIEYRYISVNVTEFNRFGVDDLYQMDWNSREQRLHFGSDINVLSYTNCSQPECLYLVGTRFDEDSFSEFVTQKLRTYFNLNALELNANGQSSDSSPRESRAGFSVVEHSNAMELYPSAKETDFVLIALLCATGMLSLIALGAFLFNEGICCVIKPCNVVDSGRWSAIISFAVQFYDFAGDINFSIEVWQQWNSLNGRVDSEFQSNILIAAIGSTVSIVIPYLLNLRTASLIKGENGVISHNPTAQIWFANHSSIFTIFVLWSGSSYTAMEMVSSNVFGLEILDCGLTKYELKKLFRFKVFHNMMLENVPQIFIVWFYSHTIEVMTVTTWFTLIGSALSVLGTMLKYLMNHDQNDNLLPIEYYLNIQCRRNAILNGAALHGATLNVPQGAHGVTNGATTVQRTKIDRGNMREDRFSENDLTAKETKLISKNKGKKEALSQSITKTLKIPSESIEIGSTNIAKQNVLIHIVHYLDKMEFDLFAAEHQNVSGLTPYLYLRRLYKSVNEEITQILVKHFELDKFFKVNFMDNVERK